MTDPVKGYSGPVRVEWIDENDHVDSGCYRELANSGASSLLKRAGLDQAYREAAGVTFFQSQMHICFERELRLGDGVEVRSRLVGATAKAIHHYHEIFRMPQDERVATVEFLTLHIDRATRRTAAMPAENLERLVRLASQPSSAGQDNIGSRIALR